MHELKTWILIEYVNDVVVMMKLTQKNLESNIDQLSHMIKEVNE